jgi:hypothetical protein
MSLHALATWQHRTDSERCLCSRLQLPLYLRTCIRFSFRQVNLSSFASFLIASISIWDGLYFLLHTLIFFHDFSVFFLLLPFLSVVLFLFLFGYDIRIFMRSIAPFHLFLFCCALSIYKLHLSLQYNFFSSIYPNSRFILSFLFCLDDCLEVDRRFRDAHHNIPEGCHFHSAVRTWNLTFLQFVRWDMSYNLNLFSSAVHSAQFKVMVHVPPNKLYLIVNLLSLFSARMSCRSSSFPADDVILIRQ